MYKFKNVVFKIAFFLTILFGVLLAVAVGTKAAGAQETFLGSFFDDGMLDSLLKSFLMVQVAYWSLRYQLSTKAA